jgi:hypothetical protein
VCFSKSLSRVREIGPVVAYIDAIGKLDGNRCLLEWKTTTSRYPEEPNGLLALDPQLVCYSWMSGICDVALVASSESAFLRSSTSRPPLPINRGEEFGRMVDATASRIAREFDCYLLFDLRASAVCR